MYQGDWHFNEIKKEWLGNPCDSVQVNDMLEAIKQKGGEAECTHSHPMSIQIMEKIYAWSISACPDDYSVHDHDSLAFKQYHLQYWAFSAVGFTIWTWYLLNLVSLQNEY